MRVGIVNDLGLATATLRRLVESIPGASVAWCAADGAEAVARTASDRPDLILMDMIMPVMDGVEATRRIMRESPCPIVVVTATVEGNAGRVFEALSAGALDATVTPSIGPGWEAARQDLLRKIETVRKLGAGAVGAAAAGAPAQRSKEICHPRPPGRGWSGPVVAIGSSTGGPQALATVLTGLGTAFQVPVVVVQHVGRAFVPGLVSWLSRETGRRVVPSVRGQALEPGVCVVADTDSHLVVDRCGFLDEREEPADAIHRPSVDVLFRSLRERGGPPGAAVLLTGMGRDGAAAMLELRRAEWYTVAQDRATSVVWGMPGVAAGLGAASSVLPVDAIGADLEKWRLRTAGRLG